MTTCGCPKQTVISQLGAPCQTGRERSMGEGGEGQRWKVGETHGQRHVPLVKPASGTVRNASIRREPTHQQATLSRASGSTCRCFIPHRENHSFPSFHLPLPQSQGHSLLCCRAGSLVSFTFLPPPQAQSLRLIALSPPEPSTALGT